MNQKVLITIALDDAGNVSLQATSNNLVTILGMMKMGEAILLNKKEVKSEESSNLLLPKNGDRLVC